jgi:hypothetical protein
MVDERLKRLGELAEKMPESLRLAASRTGTTPSGTVYSTQRELAERWPSLQENLQALRDNAPATAGECPLGAAAADSAADTRYVDWIKALDPEAKTAGTRWLEAIVRKTIELWRT